MALFSCTCRYHDAEQTFLDWYFKYTRCAPFANCQAAPGSHRGTCQAVRQQTHDTGDVVFGMCLVHCRFRTPLKRITECHQLKQTLWSNQTLLRPMETASAFLLLQVGTATGIQCACGAAPHRDGRRARQRDPRRRDACRASLQVGSCAGGGGFVTMPCAVPACSPCHSTP